tara:strand:+ start:788 stop:1201 length:414 start_codon:yes stop_codon:yes gene_type:complete
MDYKKKYLKYKLKYLKLKILGGMDDGDNNGNRQNTNPNEHSEGDPGYNSEDLDYDSENLDDYNFNIYEETDDEEGYDHYDSEQPDAVQAANPENNGELHLLNNLQPLDNMWHIPLSIYRFIQCLSRNIIPTNQPRRI